MNGDVGGRGLALCDLLLADFDGALATLDGGALELDGSELLAPAPEIRFLLGERLLPLGQLADVAGELVLACLEVGRSETEHPLDRGA